MVSAFPPGGRLAVICSERPELDPRASKNIINLREDGEFLSLEITKRKKDKDIPLLEGQRSLVWSEY